MIDKQYENRVKQTYEIKVRK